MIQLMYPIFKVHSRQDAQGGGTARKKDAMAWSQTSRICCAEQYLIWYAAAGCGTRIVGWGTHSPGEQLPVSLVLARPAGRLRQDRKHTCAYSAYSVMILL